MAKTAITRKFSGRLSTIHVEKPFKLSQPVIVIPEEEYKEMLEDIDDLRDALKAEEEYLTTGGRLFIEYDKERKKSRR